MIEDRTREYTIWLLAHEPMFATPLTEDIRQASDPSEALDIYLEAIVQLETGIRRLWEHWQGHPDFERINQALPQSPHDPHVMGAFKHPTPGINGATHSYIITTFNDLLAPMTMRWAKKTFGEFDYLTAVPYEITDLSDSRQSFLSFDLNGSSKARYGRLRLKQLLPKKLHKLCRLARRWAATPKRAHLDSNMPGFFSLSHQEKLKISRSKSLQPDWYRNASKAELWVKFVLEPEDRKELAKWIDPVTFYRAATGEYHPDDIYALIMPRPHQPALFDILRI